MPSMDADVVVIGAGFAGLSAAQRLQRQGRRVVVLEARDRVGGRVWTRQVEGVAIDLGGQWVGPTQTRLLATIAEAGLRTFPTYAEGENVVRMEGKQRRYRGTIPRLGLGDLARLGWTQWRLDRMAKQVPPGEPWRAPRAAEWDRQTLADFLARSALRGATRQLFEVALETVFAAEAREMSLLHALFYIRSGDDLDMQLGIRGCAQDARVEGGMQGVADAMASALEVRRRTPVRRVVQRTDHVEVQGDASIVRAERAIVAVPLTLLHKIVFDPGLPEGRQELARRGRMGATIKCTAIYAEPFWRRDGLSGHSTSDEGPVHVTFDSSPQDGSAGVLVGFLEADTARQLGAQPEAVRRDAALACYARMFGERARRPVAYVDHVWEHDEWSGGGYAASLPPGLLTAHGAALRASSGRLHWAGTESAVIWNGYIDGAIRSGERAADEVQAALSVG